MAGVPIAAISDDGRWVVFESTATNLVPHGDANGTGYDVYLADLATATVTRIGVDEAGRQFGRAFAPRISGNGRFVAFAATRRSVRPVSGPTRPPFRRSIFATSPPAGPCASAAMARAGGARLGAFAPDLNADGSVVAFAIQSTMARSDIALYDAGIRDHHGDHPTRQRAEYQPSAVRRRAGRRLRVLGVESALPRALPRCGHRRKPAPRRIPVRKDNGALPAGERRNRTVVDAEPRTGHRQDRRGCRLLVTRAVRTGRPDRRLRSVRLFAGVSVSRRGGEGDSGRWVSPRGRNLH